MFLTVWMLLCDHPARVKSLYGAGAGTDSLALKIASGATTGCLGAFLANPIETCWGRVESGFGGRF